MRTLLTVLLLLLPLPVMADTLTVYPEASHGGGNVTTDEGLRYLFAASYATAHDAGTGSHFYTRDGTSATAQQYFTGTQYWVSRTGITFDTSALTSGASVSAATLSLYTTTDVGEVGAGDSIRIVSFTPDANNDIVLADFDKNQWGTTGYASDVDIGSISTEAYQAFAFNATGIAAISLTGVTQIGVRTVNDCTNTAPTGLDQMTIYMADNTGTTKDPKLVITYTAGGGAVYSDDFIWFE